MNTRRDFSPMEDEFHGAHASNVDSDMNFQCVTCFTCFGSQRGLGQHIRRKHEDLANDSIDIARKRTRWNEEEMRLVARIEINNHGAPNINQRILEGLSGCRSLDAVKNLRRQQKYKSLLQMMYEEAHEDFTQPLSRVIELDNMRVGAPDLNGVDEADPCNILRTWLIEIRGK